MASHRRRRAVSPARRLYVDRAGKIAAATQIASPNCDERPAGEPITMLVIHGISLPPGEFGGNGIIDLFTNRLDPAAHPDFDTLAAMRVSAHFLVRRDGSLLQFVPCALRAWHAGASSWRGRQRCNDFSVGIELEGTDELPYADAQYATLARLTRALQRRYPIRDLAGHDQIARGRKTDPGAAFDWTRFRHLVEPSRTSMGGDKRRKRRH
ncbi:MAG TPA: 1,6-anhydro-N-acetylmuramyl-L-alanine amidase AmpD [Casimicrobiaceae bacterium]